MSDRPNITEQRQQLTDWRCSSGIACCPTRIPGSS